MNENKYFTEKQIGFASALSGPITGGLLFYFNYKSLGKKKEANNVIIGTFFFTLILFQLLLEIPDEIMDKIPNSIITSVYGLISYVLYKKYLADEIKIKIDDGGKKASNWSVFLYSIVGLISSLLIIVLLATFEPPFEGEKSCFGQMENCIYYDSNTNNKDIEILAKELTEFGYFNEEIQNNVLLETWKTTYIITLPISKEVWYDKEVESQIFYLKDRLIMLYDKDVKIVLEDYKLDGKTIERRF